jgi:ATP-dependent exoDNAse (exonuclease V) alpha subunit
VAAIAYRSGVLLRDERQGLTHDYTRRSGVEYTELVLPEGAGEWTRENLWNAAELAEKRKDARTAREWEVALPSELTPEARRGLAVEFAQALSARYGCAVDVAVHAPSQKGDERNFHAHLMATTRAVRDGAFGEKVAIELDDKIRAQRGMEPGRREIEQVRALWAETSNRALEAHGHEQRIDHRSLATQREEALMAGDIIRSAELDRAPQTKLGWKASAMERRGVETERGQQLREVKEENALRQRLAQQVEKLRELGEQVGQYVKQGIEGLRERYEQWKQERSAGPQQAPLADKREAFLDRYEQWKQQKEAEQKKPERDIERDIGRGFGRGHGRER